MKEGESIREFVDRFNQSVGKIPLAHYPNEINQLGIFTATMEVEVQFGLRRLAVKSLVDAQKEAIKLDDDLILSGLKSTRTPQMKDYLGRFPIVACCDG